MEEIVHMSRIKIVREKGLIRRAMIEGLNEPIYHGLHEGIKRWGNHDASDLQASYTQDRSLVI